MYKIVDRRPGDVATCYANADKALAELNWKTEKKQLKICAETHGIGNLKIQMVTRVNVDF